MSDSHLRRALSGLAALLGLASPACVDPQESGARTSSSVAPPTSASSRRPAMDRERPVRVATATFAMG